VGPDRSSRNVIDSADARVGRANSVKADAKAAWPNQFRNFQLNDRDKMIERRPRRDEPSFSEMSRKSRDKKISVIM